MKNTKYEHELDLDGVGAFILVSNNRHTKVTVSGFLRDRRKFKKGHRVLLRSSEGQESRYRITDVRLPDDPKDQYFIDVEFHPR